MYHLRDNIFFGRLLDGSVRILQLKAAPAEPPAADVEVAWADKHVDLVVPAEGWASVVSSVSAGGEAGGRYDAALAFHNDVPQATGGGDAAGAIEASVREAALEDGSPL